MPRHEEAWQSRIEAVLADESWDLKTIAHFAYNLGLRLGSDSPKHLFLPVGDKTSHFGLNICNILLEVLFELLRSVFIGLLSRRSHGLLYRF